MSVTTRAHGINRGRLVKGWAVGLGAAVLAVVAAGCGGGSSATPSHHAVNLSVLAPTDGATVSVRSVEVIGNVSPRDAVVSVSGRPAVVQSGVFRVPLTLSEPFTRITVAATATGYTSSSTGITVHYAALAGGEQGNSSAGASYTPGGSAHTGSGSKGSGSEGLGLGGLGLRGLGAGIGLEELGFRLR